MKMSMKKALFLSAILVTLIGLAGLLPPGAQATRSVNGLTSTGSRTAVQAVVIPKITKATIEKKDLIVEGQNFAAGAKLLLNGTRGLKTQNDAATPGTKLIVKKGRNALSVDEIVILQVKNPDGLVSEAFGFFTGRTFTYHNTRDGDSNSLHVGEIFLMNFEDSEVGLGWQIHDYGNYEQSGGAIEPITFNVSLMPDAQGLFFAKQPGSAYFRMTGLPLGAPPFLWLVNLDVR